MERKTFVIYKGTTTNLRDIYNSIQYPTILYARFRQRIIVFRNDLTPDHVIDAATLDQSNWVSKYGGGRYRSFIYNGSRYSELRGCKFHSIASFLKEIGRYENRQTVYARVKRGWTIDRAIDEDKYEDSSRNGLIYMLQSKSNNKKYVGLTFCLNKRIQDHARKEFNDNISTVLAAHIREFGFNDLTVTILEGNIPYDLISQREQELIQKHNTVIPHGLNMVSGGQIGFRGIPYKGYKSKMAYARSQAEKMGIPDYIIYSRILNGGVIPKNPRKMSIHPDAGSNLHRRWKSLLKRCRNNPETQKISSEWQESYDNFKKDVIAGYSKEKKLVRIHKHLAWGKDNFEWVSPQECVARTHGKSIECFNIKYNSLASIAKAYNIGESTLRNRVNNIGLSIEDAVTVPMRAKEEKL